MAQKRKMLTLDLNAANATTSKKSKIVTASHILTSPDVQKLKLSTPEMAEFLSRNSTLATPTPSGTSGPNYMFPMSVTEAQERYVKGFEDALKNIKSQEGPAPGQLKPEYNTAIETIERATAANAAANHRLSSPRPSSSASGSVDSSDLRIKEELEDDSDEDSDFSEEETAPVTSKRGKRKLNVGPIDMVSQEKIKLERKRMRNRLAASKCRKRKLERIAQLEYKVKDLKGENSELATVVKKLKESVYNLKQEVIEHVNSGCQINMGNEVNFS